jgi:hypothetical protein
MSFGRLDAHSILGFLKMPDMSVQLSPTVIPDIQPSPPRGTAACDLDRMLHKWQSRFTGGRSPSWIGRRLSANQPQRQKGNTMSWQGQRNALVVLAGNSRPDNPFW